MRQHLNTLYVTTPHSYVSHEDLAVVVRSEGAVRLKVPIHTLGGIVCFGQVSCSPSLMALSSEHGVVISFLTASGRFLARVEGRSNGNVLLRRQQYRAADTAAHASALVAAMVTAKIANCRTVLFRAARDRPQDVSAPGFLEVARLLKQRLLQVRPGLDVDALRGYEGDAARLYFGAFDGLITAQKDEFFFRGRSRRPPLDNVNALLSFLYSLLEHDARSALQAAGLDPSVGFLHADRPGRPGLSLDMIEELRPLLADRVALSLINLRVVQPEGFARGPTGGVTMTDDTRKKVLVAYQKRKQEEVVHPFLGERISVGLIVHLQARLLARHLRGDLDGYPAFIWK